MKVKKTSRFTVEESSWNYDLSRSITGLLSLIPEKDETIDVPKLLFDCLKQNVGWIGSD